MEARVTRISVIVPCRNEAAHVDAFCEAVAAQRLPAGIGLEVLIADGESDDGTRAKLDARAAADARFVVIDNPGRIVSTGLNACIARARGEVIARMDVHTTYADDYLAACLAALQASGAANVGGPWRAEGEGAMERAIAAAFQSRWVAGGARSRDLAYEGPVDTVYLGCWPRGVFARHGGFDETLVRNQDDEHNLRLVKAGELVWQTPSARSSYRPRASLGRLFEQQRQYGAWKPAVWAKHRRAGSWRPFAPGALVGALAVLGLATASSPWLPLETAAWVQLAFGLLLGSYALYLIAATAVIARTLPRPRGEVAGDLPAVIATMQLGYGIGLWQGVPGLLRARRGAPADARLSR
ncbi:MAG TPA: glycosyltransferase family 2 protein [Methylibium sp.]|uniref:glycosyltransferase family 2 protein n=1 Tax=Methylibium sp. TaxID=2067992 RepID=UPI002DBB7A22|nr:glycosyltransferase family 2 protein [Methylibium sp.]HEU4460740.1 glycosyltransferase family 2 protein [Methylibium sp.]